MSESRLTFQNNKGENLVGLLLDTDSNDVVLLCHGYMAHKDMCHLALVARSLADCGLSSFRFDHPHAWKGESERQGPFMMGNHEEEVDDMKCAVKFMMSRGKRVSCLVGHSKGGTNALMYAATVGDIPAILILAGRFHVRAGLFQRVSLHAPSSSPSFIYALPVLTSSSSLQPSSEAARRSLSPQRASPPPPSHAEAAARTELPTSPRL